MMATEDNIDKKTGVIIRYDDNGFAWISMPVGRVPYKQWLEWEQQCKSEYNGNRWLKIWTDHNRIKNFDLQAELEYYKQQLNSNQTEEDTNPLGLLNGGDE